MCFSWNPKSNKKDICTFFQREIVTVPYTENIQCLRPFSLLWEMYSFTYFQEEQYFYLIYLFIN